MKKYYFGMALFIGVMVYAVINFSVGPQPVGVMKASFFDQPKEIGVVTFRRLYDPLTREPVVAFGVTPGVPEHREILEGFLIAAAAEKNPIHIVYKERHLDPLSVPEGTEIIEFDFNAEEAEVAERIRAQTDAGKRVLLYTASILSTHVIKDNPIHRFEKFLGKPVYSISTVGINVRREQEVKLDPPCLGSEVDGRGTADLGCAAQLKARSLYRKNIDNSRFVALMDQRGVGDMLLFVSIPPQPKNG